MRNHDSTFATIQESRDSAALPGDACSVDGCAGTVLARGLCRAHYRRVLHHGGLELSRRDQRKKHPLYQKWARFKFMGKLSHEWLSFWTFAAQVGEKPSGRHRLFQEDNSLPLGPSNFEWKAPFFERGEAMTGSGKSRYMKKYQAEMTPDTERKYYLKKTYGITSEDYADMLVKQSGLCAICHEPERATGKKKGILIHMAVDHDHDTGKVRGLLCRKCNSMLGHAKDSIAVLQSAVEYLRPHKTSAAALRETVSSEEK